MELTQVRFGVFCLDLQRRVLWRDGPACLRCPLYADGCQKGCDVEGRAVATRVGQRACDVLSTLVAAKGAVVSKDSLMANAWPGQIVEENTLQAQISLLRKALGETSQHRIITVPGRGYRLMSESVAAEEAATSAVIADPKLRGQPAIAVVPFDNLSGDPAEEWLADGIAEDLIIELSRSRFWIVISRGSSFVFKNLRAGVRQIGEELGARYVLEGTVRRSGDRLRVTAHLAEAEHGVSVWTERYDRAWMDSFGIQEEITRSVARAIGPAVENAEISRAMRKRLDSLDAWEAWQRSKSHREVMDWESAELLLRRSITLDPGFAPPHAERAFYLWAAATAEWLPIRETRAEAESEAREAIRLDPSDAVGHAVLSLCKGGVRDTMGALHIAERAVELGPSAWPARIAMVIAEMGARRFDKAAVHLEILHQICPRGGSRRKTLELSGLLHFLRGEYEIAAAIAGEVVATQPNYPHAYWILLASLGHLGRRDKTQILMSQWHAVAPCLPVQLAELGVSWLSKEDSDRVLLGLRAAGWDR